MKNKTPTHGRLRIKTYTLCSLIFLHTSILLAQTPDIDTIIDRIDYNQVFDTATVRARLTVTNNLGTIENSFQSYSQKNGDTLVSIITGPDRGQKILRRGKSIFLYFPDAEEIIRLQGSALRDSVMGSDFSYEDITGDNSIKTNFTIEFLGTATIDDNLCYHLILTAKNRREIYQKQELFIDTELFIPRKIILYSASGKALRELHSTDFISVAGRTIPKKTLMTDLLKNNSTTLMEIDSIKIDIPLDPEIFMRENLTW